MEQEAKEREGSKIILNCYSYRHVLHQGDYIKYSCNIYTIGKVYETCPCYCWHAIITHISIFRKLFPWIPACEVHVTNMSLAGNSPCGHLKAFYKCVQWGTQIFKMWKMNWCDNNSMPHNVQIWNKNHYCLMSVGK